MGAVEGRAAYGVSRWLRPSGVKLHLAKTIKLSTDAILTAISARCATMRRTMRRRCALTRIRSSDPPTGPSRNWLRPSATERATRSATFTTERRRCRTYCVIYFNQMLALGTHITTLRGKCLQLGSRIPSDSCWRAIRFRSRRNRTHWDQSSCKRPLENRGTTAGGV